MEANRIGTGIDSVDARVLLHRVEQLQRDVAELRREVAALQRPAKPSTIPEEARLTDEAQAEKN